MSVFMPPAFAWGHHDSAARQVAPPEVKPLPSASGFGRSVHARRWSALWPLLAALMAGAAMLWAYAAPPPSAAVLYLYESGTPANASYADPAAGVNFELTPNWTWPKLTIGAQPSHGGSCTRAASGSAC